MKYNDIMPFGKHKGSPLDEVPRDYLSWLFNQPDLRRNLRQSIQRVLDDKPSTTPKLKQQDGDLRQRVDELLRQCAAQEVSADVVRQLTSTTP